MLSRYSRLPRSPPRGIDLSPLTEQLSQVIKFTRHQDEVVIVGHHAELGGRLQIPLDALETKRINERLLGKLRPLLLEDMDTSTH